jgi:hypothetical protein
LKVLGADMRRARVLIGEGLDQHELVPPVRGGSGWFGVVREANTPHREVHQVTLSAGSPASTRRTARQPSAILFDGIRVDTFVPLQGGSGN